jgi:hypothetical protein
MRRKCGFHRYQLYKYSKKKDTWNEYGKFCNLYDISEKIGVSYLTAYNIVKNKAKKFGKIYKIIKL